MAFYEAGEGPDYSKIEIMSPATQRARRNLIIVSSIAMVAAMLNIQPTKIQAFGIELSTDDRLGLYLILVALNIGLYVSYCSLAWEDFARVRLRSQKARFEHDFGAKKRIEQLRKEEAKLRSAYYELCDKFREATGETVNDDHPEADLHKYQHVAEDPIDANPADLEKYRRLSDIIERMNERRKVDGEIYAQEKRIAGFSFWMIEKAQKWQIALAFPFPLAYGLLAIGMTIQGIL